MSRSFYIWSLLCLLVFPALQADSAVILFQRTQEAIDTPFEALRNPDYNGDPSLITATTVQEAIEEVFATAPGNQARTGITAGGAGNLNNKYLEFFRSVPSDITPFVFAEDAEVVGISCATSTSSSNDYEIRLNGTGTTPIYTLNKISSTTASASGLTLPANTGDTLNIYVTNGAAKDPVCTLFFQVAL